MLDNLSQSNQPVSVSIILIGNELLSGKIVDENGGYVIRRLRSLGAHLLRLVMIPDERAVIIDEVRRCAALSDFVITSGGVGPTHDDITLECIAEALNQPSIENERLGSMIRNFFGDRLTDAHLRMASIPKESELIEAGENTWPVVKAQNIFVLPGVPGIFRAKFEAVCDVFRRGEWYLRSIYLNADEGRIAAQLLQLEKTHGVAIGSYPRLRAADFRVRVTVEARSPGPVNDAVQDFISSIDPAWVVRLDPVID